jgi:NADPH-dependent ferric siderophore reductase
MYYLKWADSASAARVVEAMFPSKARAVPDSRMKALSIVGQEEDMPAITAALQKLEDQAKAAAEAERMRVSQ